MNDGRVLLFTLVVHCVPDLRQHCQLHAVRGNAGTARQDALLEKQAQVMCLQLLRSFALRTGKSFCLGGYWREFAFPLLAKGIYLIRVFSAISAKSLRFRTLLSPGVP